MHHKTDILIIGGGLAGLTSAIHLSKAGLKVILIEKNAYPNHKVCGEYISNEILPYLQSLGADPLDLQPTKINRLQFSTVSGETVQAQLPLGGFGISRYSLDEFLCKKAMDSGCTVIQDTVTAANFENDQFSIQTPNQTFESKIVLAAHGKRSALDHKLKRNFIAEKSPWLAVKAHYRGKFSNDLIALHNFKGGYCGASKVENDLLNICYLVDYATFKSYKNIEEHRKNILYKNKHLEALFENSTMEFDAPISISQISFQKKECVKNHMLMIGDTAGLIHPLCGNGMAMAIHSAKIGSELVIAYFKNSGYKRTDLENDYQKLWRKNFSHRMKMGTILSEILKKDHLAGFMLNGLTKFPSLFPVIIKQTHGKTLSPAS